MNRDDDRRPEIEARLERLRFPPPRAGLREEIAREIAARRSVFHLGRVLPWAAAAALLLALFVAVDVREGRRHRRMAGWTKPANVPEPQRRWAAYVRLIHERGSPNG
jgi:hypothetical protein